MSKSQEKIAEMVQVLAETEGKTDLVSTWARTGVKSEAGMNIAYLKRRLDSLYEEDDVEEQIERAEGFIKQLTPIYEAK